MTKQLVNKEEEYHWLNGIEMYINRYLPENLERFHTIKEAVLRGNVHKIKELVLQEIHRGVVEETWEFVNVIFNTLTEYENMNHRKLIKFIAHCIDDEYLRRIGVTSIKFHSKLNLNDHYSKGQMMSKLWLVDELKKINKEYKNVAMFGGWYASIYQLLLREFDIEKFRNYEIDGTAATISEEFNWKELSENWKFKSVVKDVGEIKWHGDNIYHQAANREGKLISEEINIDLIINTSCEHMDETWFHNIPKGKLVALQTNDYFSNEQHINCVNDQNEAMEKYPMSKLLYVGTMNTSIYNRFMVIGIK
jgi:hypothetical protein